MSEYTCAFLNLSGDITITWDEHNKEAVLEVIRKKMEEGYVFFTTKKYMFGTIERKTAVTKRDLSKLKSLIIDDETFEEYLKHIDDPDLARLVKNTDVKLGKREGSKKIESLRRARSAEEVIDSPNNICMRPLQGG